MPLTDSGDGGDDLSQFEFVQDGGFASSIQTYHQDSHLFLPKEILKEACKHVPHGGRSKQDKNTSLEQQTSYCIYHRFTRFKTDVFVSCDTVPQV